MQNYSQTFHDTLAEFVSPVCANGEEDAAKGQVLVRAGYKINLINANIGYIGKTAGQTQYLGVSVDALKDKSDGSWDDYLTDVPSGPSHREIRVVRSAHNGTGPDATGWVQPTAMYTQQGGPLTLAAPGPGPGPGPDPGPGPTPPADNTEVIAKLDEVLAMLERMQETNNRNTASIIARDDFNTEKIQQQLHQIVEDFEASAKKVLAIWMASRPDQPPIDISGSGGQNDIVLQLLKAYTENRPERAEGVNP